MINLKRKIDSKAYLDQLMQSLTVNDLKQICRDLKIKGFSKLKKSELVEFILGSLADEEVSALLEEKELEIISKGVNEAFDIIHATHRDSLKTIRIVNDNAHEIEMDFKGLNWETTSFISINKENINNPERDCDCTTGSANGLCRHFWLGVIFSLKKDYFDISDWTLTILPDGFEDRVEDLKITTTKDSGELNLVDGSSGMSFLTENIDSKIYVNSGEVTNVQAKSYNYEGRTVSYYLIDLKDIQISLKDNQSKFESLGALKIRLSEKVYDNSKLKTADRISFEGKIVRNDFTGFLVQNIYSVNDPGAKTTKTTKATERSLDKINEPLLRNHVGKRITVYEGEIADITEKSYEYQDEVVTYFLLTLKDIKFGPQIKKKSDYKEEDIKDIERLIVRLSDKTGLGMKVGEKISLNGAVNVDNYLGFMLKRATKVKKISI